MASGSSNVLDFASDDILSSYTHHQQSNATHQEFNKRKIARIPNDDSDNQEVIIRGVERSMKKQTDDVMRFLDGLSLRLSQLELYCYNVDKSLGEMRSDLAQDHAESYAKLNFLEKHLQEVHRSVQILRDKQELADTQKELAKLKLARKESSSSSHNSQLSTPDMRKSETHGQQLALVPASVSAPQPLQGYYMPPTGSNQNPQSQLQPQAQTFPQYQWTLQATVQPGSRLLSSPQVYPDHLPTKPPLMSQSPEPLPNSTPMQMTYSTVPLSGPNQPVTTYSYGPPAQTAQPQPPPQPGYAAGGPPNAYVVYDNAPGRVQHSSQGGQFYPLNLQQSGGGITPQQFNGRGRGWSG